MKTREYHSNAYNNLGWVFIAADGGEEDNDDDEFYNDFVKSYDSELGWGFKRPERLDVKKPGPFYNTNNYAFAVSSTLSLLTLLYLYIPLIILLHRVILTNNIIIYY